MLTEAQPRRGADPARTSLNLSRRCLPTYAESVFRTAKYRPELHPEGFADLEQSRQWASELVHWYNYDHRHSGIRYVSPAQRHAGEEQAIRQAREEVYEAARARNPRRRTRGTRTQNVTNLS